MWPHSKHVDSDQDRVRQENRRVHPFGVGWWACRINFLWRRGRSVFYFFIEPQGEVPSEEEKVFDTAKEGFGTDVRERFGSGGQVKWVPDLLYKLQWKGEHLWERKASKRSLDDERNAWWECAWVESLQGGREGSVELELSGWWTKDQIKSVMR